jgi:hypothetical protein
VASIDQATRILDRAGQVAGNCAQQQAVDVCYSLCSVSRVANTCWAQNYVEIVHSNTTERLCQIEKIAEAETLLKRAGRGCVFCKDISKKLDVTLVDQYSR